MIDKRCDKRSRNEVMPLWRYLLEKKKIGDEDGAMKTSLKRARRTEVVIRFSSDYERRHFGGTNGREREMRLSCAVEGSKCGLDRFVYLSSSFRRMKRQRNESYIQYDDVRRLD